MGEEMRGNVASLIFERIAACKVIKKCIPSHFLHIQGVTAKSAHLYYIAIL